MPSDNPLPLGPEWTDPDSYVDALLAFATSDDLFRNLCGGVHILDFLTREPSVYTTLLQDDWRDFFEEHDIHDILHLLLREDVGQLRQQQESSALNGHTAVGTWRGGPLPPISLLDYISNIRRLSLRRDFTPVDFRQGTIPPRLAIGMKTKKLHEVENFSHYVDQLCGQVAELRGEDVSHVVDFGSGQNYLGRTLANSYNKHIIAIEREHQHMRGANRFDQHALGIKKEVIWQNNEGKCEDCDERPTQKSQSPVRAEESATDSTTTAKDSAVPNDSDFTVINVFRGVDIDPEDFTPSPRPRKKGVPASEQPPREVRGAIDYIEHNIKDGYLEPIIKHIMEPSTSAVAGDSSQEATVVISDGKAVDARCMVVSLHSCGNLVHHGIRSLVLNPSVVAVAMIGCCYNLMTERLGPITWKLPILRSLHPRLQETSRAYDPHGFPMSQRMENFAHEGGTGVKLNITARSMAVQAPYNWGREDSESFFTRHYYRALLQRILVDKEIIPRPVNARSLYEPEQAEIEATGPPLIVGSLRKAAFTSFPAYVRAAVSRLCRDAHYGAKVQERLANITDEELERYVQEYAPTKKHLSVTWSLMALSASVIEAIIVVDRWQFLREHESVKDCWVEPVFAYKESPRNLAVIGIKK
ncbi:hypothetical protein ASPZODRAFT_149939 [Penicilliopsis zonata CBS 506.65]|uniref:Methyltransferase domain-containing protein n=1 Tax=Penicilliopsis zonata CBS 506.65 TaxID=1073090 RepID=A0A1L9SPB7_9EURO|nr:hypothetical protein ASPZODRAFT_149939 [Penicilliopsis zonata CBS 506.65]OJJ48966.1 hypothetical protein ASPZODRAFT_149939 [Penicilliopsis zonata CBS 506.65]